MEDLPEYKDISFLKKEFYSNYKETFSYSLVLMAYPFLVDIIGNGINKIDGRNFIPSDATNIWKVLSSLIIVYNLAASGDKTLESLQEWKHAKNIEDINNFEKSDLY